jgi:hypothetical protein
MKHGQLQELSVEELVERFARNAVEQDNAMLDDDNKKFNRLYSELDLIERALKLRDGDARQKLVPLLKHGNGQVRLRAAIALLALEPEAARATLQSLSDANVYPQAADARGMIRALDEGSYVPS